MTLKNAIGLLLIVMLTSLGALDAQAEEYFVSKRGDDANDGLRRDAAFQTIQQGVNALAPGDTLTIAPGEYFEQVSCDDLGHDASETTIRAAIPGTVVLRGDRPAPKFEKVEGYRYVYAADFSRNVEAANELDTLSVLQTVPNIPELEFNSGRFYHDQETGKLYISTSDLRAPEAHRYTVSVLEGRAGLFLQRPRRVVVDGLAVTGFHNDTPMSRLPDGNSDSDRSTWGIFLARADRCVIRNATAWLNTGGIVIRSHRDLEEAGRNLIENCMAYGNGPRHGIMTYHPNQDTVRDSVSFLNRVAGIQFYLGGGDTSRMVDNLAWGNGSFDFKLKAGGSRPHAAERAVGPGQWAPESRSDRVVDSLIGAIADGADHFRNNIRLDQQADLDLNQAFADPVNHDYRLQATSPLRGSAPDGGDPGPFPYKPNIYYVSPDGNDSADGLSVSNAWRTLTRTASELDSGDTLYLETGLYSTGLEITTSADSDAAPTRIRGRGTGQAVIQGPVRIAQGSHIEFERVNFTDRVTVQDSADVQFKNCQFLGSNIALQASEADGLRVTQSVFTGFETTALDLAGSSDVFLSGNIFDNLQGFAVRTAATDTIYYSDYNSYRDADAAWQIGGAPQSLAALQPGIGQYSQTLTPEFRINNGKVELRNPLAFALGGPHGQSFGVQLWQRQIKGVRDLRIDGPTVHSTTATTANLEWWSSHPAVFRVHWGLTAKMQNSRTLTSVGAYHPAQPLESYNTFSLSGLNPNTTYHFRIEFVSFVDDDSRANIAGLDDQPISFTTKSNDPEPRTLHVSPDGDNGNTGLSRSDAWRTISRAADEVRPGDTVLIGGGTYHERVRIRVTGAKGAPITFKAHPGEKVVLDGADQSLQTAFTVFNNKDYLNFDGLYTREYTRGLKGNLRVGVFGLMRSDHIRITRVFHDGRQGGYAPELVTASSVNDLLIKNCVVIRTWDNIGLGDVSNVRIENNVLVLPLIRAIPGGGENIQVRNNIITDNLEAKRGSFLVRSGMRLENNCFFLRWPESERSVFGRGEASLADYNTEHDLDQGNTAADPQFAGIQSDDHGRAYFGGGMVRKFEDFPDLFATNPTLTEGGIGLIRSDFEDFHFHDSANGD